MTLHIFKETAVRLPRKKIYALFNMIARKEAPNQEGQINLVMTTDRDILGLNERFRQKAHATDVLSFNIDSDGGEDNIFGEIYISVETARRQAEEYDDSLSGELLRLTCHGMLHLLGYDHEDPDEARRMRRREEEYLARVRRVS